jgi:uncharacterized membrane protein YgcG
MRTSLLAAAILAIGIEASAIEIARFEVTIGLARDATILVTETIEVDFGTLERHGIFRTIPIRYARTAELAGVPVTGTYALRLSVDGVSDEAGNSLPFSTWREDRSLSIRIGDPDRTVTGRTTYVISYRVARAIHRFETHDELYWNVTGTEWDWPIHRAAARVRLPREVPPENLQHATFTGVLGSPATNAIERVSPSLYEAEVADLLPGEGLTIVLGLPKGILERPSAWRELWWKLTDNALFFLVALCPLFALGAMTLLYLRFGRDPGARTPIVVQYAPPDELSPAEVGSLLDESVDTPDLVSTVIDLAVRGYLTIEEVETTRFLFLESKDYRFLKTRPPDDALQPHERAFHQALFASGDSVLLSSLKNRFYTSLPAIQSAVARQMLEKELFPRDPARVRHFYRTAGGVIAFLPLPLALFLLSSGRGRALLPPEPGGFFLFAALCLFAGYAIVALFSRFMPAKTAKGARVARQCLGFQEFVTRVEKDRIARMAKEDPTLFERVLPYAVVLGCADEWAERFEGLLSEPPAWYRSPSMAPGPFNSRALVSNLGRSMHSMGSTLTSQPRQSGSGFSAGRGSSGFGGGGRSGGGFGGGGGRSW